MITENYVSLETAKLLSTKGFKGEFHKHYWGYEPGKEFLTDGYFNPEYDYPAPTLQIVMKWLREVHNTFISVEPGKIFGRFDVYVYYDNYTKLRIIERNKDNYEEACESGIKYALENLI